MALLIYMKGDQKAPLVLKGDMEMLDKKLERFNESVLDDQGMDFETFTGNKVKFMNCNQWGYVIEEKDSVIKKQLEDIKKKQAEQQDAMDRAQGKKMIQTLNPVIPRRRGH